MIKIIAVLCQIGHPEVCHTEAVTNSDLQEGLTMTACLVGQPALAQWMQSRPQWRLVKWRCQLGEKGAGI